MMPLYVNSKQLHS